MICIQCGAKISDASEVKFCPKCGASLNNRRLVSDHTRVNWKDEPASGDTKVNLAGNKRPEQKTMILPDFGEGLPVSEDFSEAAPKIRTSPQMEFSEKDFEKYGQFEDYESNPYGIEMPKPRRRESYREERYEEKRDMQRSRRAAPSAVKEKYFPNGFLQDDPDAEREQIHHRIGFLDILAALAGIAVVIFGAAIFKTSGGLGLIGQFFGQDFSLLLANIDDITYFSVNMDVTWRLYYEVAAMAILGMLLSSVLIIVHCFTKNMGIAVLKAVVLMAAGVGMLVLNVGYFFYFILTVGGGRLLSGGLIMFGGIGVLASAVIWLIYMEMWGFTSFFKKFHPATMALLALAFVFSFGFMLLNLLAVFKLCRGIMPLDAMYELMSTPALTVMFMVLSIIASLEDFLAKRDLDDGNEM